MKLKSVNKIILWTLTSLTILTIIGLLNFGHGLGNIIYFPPIIFANIGHFIITKHLTKKKNDNYWLPIILVSIFICIGILYSATLGRGPEFAWNGKIFFTK
ncbi:MAG: hypothetical protein JST62_05185 [Bacteroidetes bacterium]|jgi:hypothetical protein|nr:hypothetical protein [Bacteroidota bacterium]